MKTTFLLTAILVIASSQVQSASSDELEAKLRNNAIESNQLNELLGKKITAWDSFTPIEKQIAAKGAIISMDMETSEDASIFQQHAQAVIVCMDTNGYRIAPMASVKIVIGIAECAAKTYKKYCITCKP